MSLPTMSARSTRRVNRPPHRTSAITDVRSGLSTLRVRTFASLYVDAVRGRRSHVARISRLPAEGMRPSARRDEPLSITPGEEAPDDADHLVHRDLAHARIIRLGRTAQR